MDFFKAVKLDEAANILKSILPEMGHEEIDLVSACGKILYEDIKADIDVPHFSRSTVDGYAVLSRDTTGSTASVPAMLKKAGAVEMGKGTNLKISRGEAVYVPTGGALPEGADSVSMIEDSEDFIDFVAIYKALAVNENVITKGFDIKEGDTIIKKGEILSARHLGVAAACGRTKVKVFKPLRFAVISSGDELIEPSITPETGKIRDINSYLLSSAVIETGGVITFHKRIKDSEEELKNALSDALEASDVVLLSGGSSVGRGDLTAKMIKEMGEILCHGIAVKPGKPTIIAKAQNKAVIGLPGHPMAAYMMFTVLFDKALERKGKKVIAKSEINFPSGEGKTALYPVKLKNIDGELKAMPLFSKSGMISTLSEADGFAVIEDKAEGVLKGALLTVYPF
ncbi:MAG: molybdopterin molybdotransferase MoeA [Clostridiales bacterium]|nr:molybdopterin molybdotransferase MoeA [Clostridiales bacterium]